MVWIKRYSRLGSLLSGLLCATLPLLLFHSQEIRHYTLLALLTALSLYWAARVAEEPDRPLNYLGLGLSLAAAVAAHLLGIFILGAAVILIASTPGARRRVDRLKLGAALLLPAAAFGFFFLFFLRDLQSNITAWWVPPVSWELLGYTSHDVFGVEKLLWPIPKIKSLLNWRSHWVNLLYVGAFPAFGLLLALFGNWQRSFPLLAAACFYWLELLAYSLAARPLVLSRTVLPGMVPLLGFLGLQAASIRPRGIRALAALFIVYIALVFSLHWVRYDARSARELWRDLSQALQAERSPEDPVIFYPSYTLGPVRYYYPQLAGDRTLAIGVGLNPKVIDQEFNFDAGPFSNLEPGQDLYLVLRRDSLVEQDKANYRRILENLESRFGKPETARQFGDLFLSRYGVR
jgi:hypothetical protein